MTRLVVCLRILIRVYDGALADFPVGYFVVTAWSKKEKRELSALSESLFGSGLWSLDSSSKAHRMGNLALFFWLMRCDFCASLLGHVLAPPRLLRSAGAGVRISVVVLLTLVYA